jgi:hypothetical protein
MPETFGSMALPRSGSGPPPFLRAISNNSVSKGKQTISVISLRPVIVSACSPEPDNSAQIFEAAALGPDVIDAAEVRDATAVDEVFQVENLGFAPRRLGGLSALQGQHAFWGTSADKPVRWSGTQGASDQWNGVGADIRARNLTSEGGRAKPSQRIKGGRR